MQETEPRLVIPESLRHVPNIEHTIETIRAETNLTHKQIGDVLAHLHAYGLFRKDQTYNGWTNYETWCIHLWLTNEEATYRFCRGLARQAAMEAPGCRQVREQIWTVEEAKKFLLADQLKEVVSEMNPLASQASMFSDVLGANLSEVDWHDVAEAFLEE